MEGPIYQIKEYYILPMKTYCNVTRAFHNSEWVANKCGRLKEKEIKKLIDILIMTRLRLARVKISKYKNQYTEPKYTLGRQCTWVAIPAWSVPGTQSVGLPFIRLYLIIMSWKKKIREKLYINHYSLWPTFHLQTISQKQKYTNTYLIRKKNAIWRC